MPRFRDYYKQFVAMDPEEVSAELRARRVEEKRRALSRVEPLDLTGAGWFEPPHPEAVRSRGSTRLSARRFSSSRRARSSAETSSGSIASNCL